MAKPTPTRLAIDTALLCRQLGNGDMTVAPVADPGLVSYGSESGALQTQQVFLEEYLLTVRPEVLARFCLPAETALREVEVPLRRPELPERIRWDMKITFPCLLVPQKRDFWVIVPVVGHTFFASHREDMDEAIRREIARVVLAGEYRGSSYWELFPAESATLETMTVELEHGGEGVTGRAGGLRKKLIAEHRRKQAEELLESVAVPVHERVGNARRPALVGRERALRQLGVLLGDAERTSLLLVGTESAGKTALIHEWIGRGREAGTSLRVYATSAAQLIAGMSGFGQWQERVRKVMEAAEHLDALLYFENFAELFGERPERGGIGIAGLMRRYVVEGRVRVVGEISPTALDTIESRHVALLGAFHRIRVAPLSAEATVEALEARIWWWNANQPERPQVDPELCRPVVELCERYLPYRAFPGKALRFVEELRATAESERESSGRVATIHIARAYDAFSSATGIPAFLLRDDRALMVDSVIARFRRRMIGQDEAVRRVVETICMVKARLQPGDKPLCTFLFVGPTGVGKTELARTLAEFLFGSEDRMVRFDMSEYTDPFAAERLIRGTHSEDGLLTSKVREQPFCVLLLDEIEKAHPAVFDLLLQVLGEGRLTDARGKTAFFHNAIIIMTSNLGAAHRRGPLGLAARPGPRSARYMNAVASAFRPEFVNRLDRVIAFSQLLPAQVREVTRIAVARIRERRGIAGRGIALSVSDRALDILARGGFSETYGVRALRRHLDDRLVAPMARLLARVGAQSEGALLTVAAADEEVELGELSPRSRITGEVDEPRSQAERQPPTSEQDGGDALRYDIYRRKAAAGRRALVGVAGVADLRRLVERYLELDRVVAVADQIGLLRSQLATAGRKDTGSARSRRRRDEHEVDALRSEYHRLSSLWDQAEALRSDLRAVEEIALAALFDGQEADEWAAEAAALYRDFRRKLFWLLVARQECRDEITVICSDVCGAGLFHHWLQQLLDELPLRGWTLSAHVHGMPNKGELWPPERVWAPPRTAGWLRNQLLSRPSSHRDVLLRISGPAAAILVGLEVGLHRFHGFHPRYDPAPMTVSLVAMRTEFTDKEWLESLLSERGASTVSDRGQAERERFAGSDEVRVCSKERRLAIPRAQYWRRIEEIALEHLLHSIDDDSDPENARADALFRGALPDVMPTPEEERQAELARSEERG